MWLSTRHASNLLQHELCGVWRVIHKDMPCIQRMVFKVRYNTCFKDVLPIDLSIEVASYFNEVKLMIHIPTPWLGLLRKEQFPQCYAQHKQCSVVAIRALCHLSRATRSDFRRSNEFSSTRPNSIDDVFDIIANGKLCVLVLVNISLHVFLNDSKQISDDFGLFLQIATDEVTTVFSKQY